jgi:hypothetical protein
MSSRLLLAACLLTAVSSVRAADDAPDWAAAHRRKPMTAEEARAFLKRLARFVYENHLKREQKSEQRGMVYEYLDMRRQGEFDQFVQGEALDTMHDGAWLAAALVNAHRATDDPFYKTFLTRWQLPFYCKMLNHSDTLFTAKNYDARKGANIFNKEHALQEGEKGFVPYFWDDGGSVSLERRRDKNPLGPFACVDRLAAKENPRFLLDGYSLGSSNHLAQDLGVMLQQAWLLLRESPDDDDKKLAAEVAVAARNLHECRMRHFGHIPMCDAPAALAGSDVKLLASVPDQSGFGPIANHYTKALVEFAPGQRLATPGFADDQEYRYYFGLARHGGQVPKALAFRLIYDAYTEPLLYRYYSDDASVPPGVNRFDLATIYFKDGKPEDYRSDRKGPGGKPRPIGSRMGPQNMVVCGWGLQLLRAYPGLWDKRAQMQAGKDVLTPIFDPVAGAQPSKAAVAAFTLGGVELKVQSSRTALEIEGTTKADELTLKIFQRADGQGTYAAATLKKDKSVAVVNDKGEALQNEVTATPGDKGLSFRLRLPYTVVKGQKPWANGVEHGRLSLTIGEEKRNLYLASPEAQVKAWLERELSGGLRTWEAIFRSKGYVPTGLDAGGDWDHFSDAGGYAHLMSATAQWIQYLEGKKDWELQHIPTLEKGK